MTTKASPSQIKYVQNLKKHLGYASPADFELSHMTHEEISSIILKYKREHTAMLRKKGLI